MSNLESHVNPPSSNRRGATLRIALQFARGTRPTVKEFTFYCLLGLAAGTAWGSELSVDILDKAGRAVSDAVVILSPLNSRGAAPASATAAAVMDQAHLAFVPSVLVVAVGTSVMFPNSDTTSHQVYSFSPAKKFQLPLYKGQVHPPVKFDTEGLVVLGCNIHDHMVGYIYVTAAPYFGKSDAAGTFHVPDLKGGDYQLTIWSPYIADSPRELERTVHLEAGTERVERFRLALPLRPQPEPRPHRADWAY